MINQEKLEQLVSYITDCVINALEEEKKAAVITIGEAYHRNSERLFLRNFQKQIEQSKKPVYLLQKLSLESLSKIALLQGESAVEKQVQQLFEKGERVYILNQGRSYQQALSTGSYGIKKQIRQFEEQLYRYGADFVSLIEMEEERSKEQEKILTSTYITEKQLQRQKLQPNEVLQLKKESRLTDCAKDWIAEHQVKIQRLP